MSSTSRVVAIPREHETALALPRDTALPMGALLVDSGRLSFEDAERIHDYQERSGQLYGEAGIEMGLLTAQDVRLALALQFGHIALPRESGLSSELIAAWQPDSPAVEHLRSLRSQLLLRWFESDARHTALAVVSPHKGEGRSYITANLAVLFSQLGKRTLLIDADLRHPRQHRIFGIQGRIGLSALLAGRSGPEAVVDIAGVPSLAVLPAGICPPNPQELLAREGLSRLMNSLRASFEVILIDTPAASGCADAATVAARAGAALIVACRDTSSMPSVTALSDDLREYGVAVVGAVLNGAGRS
ncbi:chain length determinant protein tyrosine kinase EpsG [Ramlibacter sp. AN1015]|uniref:chain length determinant protein tyrosine kinase EpsG n=1 Tax=Ramlibacter sp. AN1015 TaxID=3133428 RepID=UPI0030BC6D2F